MTVAGFLRRWSVLIVGAVLLVCGLVIFFTHSTIYYSWVAYDPISGSALFPGVPNAHSASGAASQVSRSRHAGFNGQISIGLGIVLIVGWIGFTFRRRRAVFSVVEETKDPQLEFDGSAMIKSMRGRSQRP